MLKRYEELLPGLALRIIKMAEDEAMHRREIEKPIITAQVKDADKYRTVEMLGQVFGLTIGLSALGAATYIAVRGAQWTASIIGSAGVTGLVTAFILGRTLHMKMRQQETEIARANAQLLIPAAQN